MGSAGGEQQLPPTTPERWSAALQGAACPLRSLFEPTPGESHALNRAVSEADGEPPRLHGRRRPRRRNWIAAYARAFRRRPNAAIFGGPILPWFEGTPPAVARARLRAGGLRVRRAGPRGRPTPLRRRQGALRGEHGDAGGRPGPISVRPGARPPAGSGLRGEEVTLVKAMMRDGAEGWWVPPTPCVTTRPEGAPDPCPTCASGTAAGASTSPARDQAEPSAGILGRRSGSGGRCSMPSCATGSAGAPPGRRPGSRT